MAFTHRSIKALPVPRTGQRDYSDPGQSGLFVRVSQGGARSFVVFYRLDGKQRRDTIGRFVERAKGDEPGSLKWARAEADHIHSLAANELDPRDDRAAKKAKAAQQRTNIYKATVEDYIERFQKREKGNSSAYDVQRALLREGARWHDRPVKSITATEIQKLLEDMRDGTDATKSRPYLANRMYAYLRTFFAWSAKPGIDKLERSPMEGLSPPWGGETPRTRTFSDGEIKVLWGVADELNSYPGAFLKFLLMTGKRTSA